MSARNYFTKRQREAMVSAIAAAEKNTSAEIRVHFENYCKGDVLDRAACVFKKLEMHKTELRNGVLVYVALKDRKTAVLGDAGINQRVGDGFWDGVYMLMREKFSKGEITEGVCGAVERIGEKLRAFFPCQCDDVNELSDELSFNEEDHEQTN